MFNSYFCIFSDEITCEGAGGTVILLDSGIKLNVYSSEGDEYYSGVLAETGEGLSDWAVEWRGIGGDPLTVYILFDNSEASSAYRKVSYSATVYSTEWGDYGFNKMGGNKN